MAGIVRHVRRQIVGYIALFVALGGVSYAAVELPAGSVDTRQIRKGAVTASRIHKGAVTASKIRKGAVTERRLSKGVRAKLRGVHGPTGDVGPRGATGPKGDAGPRGAQGLPGRDGVPGSDGAPGQDGAQGPVGPTFAFNDGDTGSVPPPFASTSALRTSVVHTPTSGRLFALARMNTGLFCNAGGSCSDTFALYVDGQPIPHSAAELDASASSMTLESTLTMAGTTGLLSAGDHTITVRHLTSSANRLSISFGGYGLDTILLGG